MNGDDDDDDDDGDDDETVPLLRPARVMPPHLAHLRSCVSERRLAVCIYVLD